MLKERISLLSKNLISLKDDNQKEIIELKEMVSSLKGDSEKLKDTSQSLISETNNFVRRNEIIPVERMLRDFQPLEFARKKELDELRKELRPLAIEKTMQKTPSSQKIEALKTERIETTKTTTIIPDKRKKDVEDLLSKLGKTK
jgi:hypothetical protein